jgi:ClpP class serine protease
MTDWLITHGFLQRYREGRFLRATATAVAVEAFSKVADAARESDGGILTVAGDVAQIDVFGPLTPEPDLLAYLVYGASTSYGQIRSAIAAAESDPDIARILFKIASPGGTVDGLFETLATIQAAKKPMSVVASRADSAAYAIASVAGPIMAVSESSEFGSIGVATSAYLDPSVVDVASTNAPNKRPDASTDEGRAVIRRHLDAIHELFVEAIARGRGTSVAAVNADYGRGSVFLAREALAVGMIDSVVGSMPGASGMTTVADAAAGELPSLATLPMLASQSGAVASSPRRAQKPEGPMTLEEFKNQHPALYSQVCAAAAADAVASERDRVSGHLKFGQDSGDMETAVKAVREGSGVTHELMATYMMAAANRSDRVARQDRSDRTESVISGVAAPQEEDDGDRLVKKVSTAVNDEDVVI